MFNELEGMLQKVGGGNADPNAVGDAAEQHVAGMGGDEVAGHLNTAAENLRQDGEGGLAQQIQSMIERKQADPEALKAAAVTLIRENPTMLTRFAPPFAHGILSKLGS
jgi:hypothetical protein